MIWYILPCSTKLVREAGGMSGGCPWHGSILDTMISAGVSLKVKVSALGSEQQGHRELDLNALGRVSHLVRDLKLQCVIKIPCPFMEGLAQALPNVTHITTCAYLDQKR